MMERRGGGVYLKNSNLDPALKIPLVTLKFKNFGLVLVANSNQIV